MSADARDDGFLKRWSRLKQEARTEPPESAARSDPLSHELEIPQPTQHGATDPPAVPPVDSLTIESDYRAFFHPKIEEGLRRAALKKLFSDPHFNVMDGLDVYIDDYSVSEPLSEAALGQLEQAKKIFAWAKEDTDERARSDAARQGAVAPAPGGAEAPPAREGGMLPTSAESVDNAPTPKGADTAIARKVE